MKLLTWKYELLVLIVAGLVGEFHGRSVVQHKWNIDKAQQAQQARDALQQRHAENAALIARHTVINNTLQKAHDAEIRQINRDLARSERLRIGTQFCADPTGQTKPNSTPSSNETAATGRLLSAEVDRAVKQLILESEQAAATGRAAQAFIRENGLAE